MGKKYIVRLVDWYGNEWHEETIEAKTDRGAMIVSGRRFDDASNKFNLYTGNGVLLAKRSFGKWK